MDKKVVNYSPAEKKLLEIMRQFTNYERPIDSAKLHDLYYGEQQKPWHSQGFINSAMRSLRMKADHNGEPFMITKSKRSGPYPIEFRIVDRPPKEKWEKRAKTGVK